MCGHILVTEIKVINCVCGCFTVDMGGLVLAPFTSICTDKPKRVDFIIYEYNYMQNSSLKCHNSYWELTLTYFVFLGFSNRFCVKKPWIPFISEFLLL